MAKIVELETHDVRFPTSRHLDGSDAMSPSPDYSAAYVVLRTDDGADGHALAFTVGRGNEVQVAGIRALAPLVLGQDVDEVLDDLGAFGRGLTGDSQLRWLGPEKGVMHMAAGAVVNAAWDLRATREGKPLWQLLADLAPEEIVGLVDFRYLRDALTPEDALAILEAAHPGRDERTTARRIRLPGLRHHTGVARVRRREARPAVEAGGRRRLLDDQAEGRGGAGGGRPADDRRPRCGRPAGSHRRGRQPGVGRRRGDQLDPRAGAVRPVLDRGADLARRRPGLRPHPG